MSTLSIFNQSGKPVAATTHDFNAISAALTKVGVQFERWQATEKLTADADQATVLSAYQDSVERLNQQYGFKSVDVVSLSPDHPQKDQMRQKFLSEHAHADFEVRFFVDGSGLFYLHVDDKVYLVLCQQGDLISVPANVKHWFDMGKNPNFKCIRFFTAENGWEAAFTGDDIAKQFPSYDDHVARA